MFSTVRSYFTVFPSFKNLYFQINAHGDAVSGSVYVEAVSPSGNVHRCTVRHQDNSYMATFTPQEVGKYIQMFVWDFLISELHLVVLVDSQIGGSYL